MFAEAALRCKEGDPLVASWAQSLWKPESRAFSHIKWMVVVLPIYFLLQASFPFYLHICMSGINFSSLQCHFLMETSRPTQTEERRGETKAHISSAFQSTTSFPSNSWSELLMNNGWWPDEYAHSLLCLWGLVNNLWAKMFLTLLLYKSYEKKTTFTLWAVRVIRQSDSSPAYTFTSLQKVK